MSRYNGRRAPPMTVDVDDILEILIFVHDVCLKFHNCGCASPGLLVKRSSASFKIVLSKLALSIKQNLSEWKPQTTEPLSNSHVWRCLSCSWSWVPVQIAGCRVKIG